MKRPEFGPAALIVGSDCHRILVIATAAAGAQLALVGLWNKRFCLGKQFHDAIAAFWTLTICCDHLSSPIVDILTPV
jgi:hypothetical protein